MYLIESLLLFYFLYVVLYTLVFSVAGFYKPKPIEHTEVPPLKILLLFPAYKEDQVILQTVQHALQQDYPSDLLTILLIGQELESGTEARLQELPIQYLPLSLPNPTKVRALKAGLTAIEGEYDIAIILDADNQMEEQYLLKINRIYQAGFPAIQSRRLAKNRNNALAVLDGLSEILNLHIYRAGSNGLGLSAALSGSGMAFNYELLRSCLAEIDPVGGFDRELEIRLLLRGIKVRYYKEASIYDEKVSKQAVFAQQRRRWIASQYQYLRTYAGTGWKALWRGNMSLFNSALLRNIQLPRLLNIGLLSLIMGLSWILSPYLYWSPWIWVFLWLGLGFALFIAVPLRFYDRQFFRALWYLPRSFITMLRLMFQLKGANKRFLHTPHGEDGNERSG